MNNFKSNLDNIQIPDELDIVIEKSINRARNKKRINFYKNVATSVAVLLMVFTLTINKYSAFAETMMKVPIIKNIVEILRYDKGFENAAKEGYVNDVLSFSEDKGIIFSVQSVAGYNKRFAILYSIETKKPYQFVFIKDMKFVDEQGKEIEGIYNVYRSPRKNETKNIFTGTIDVEILDSSIIPEKIYLYTNNINLYENDNEIKVDGTWRVEVEIPKFTGMPTKKYSIDKKVLIKDIEINLGKVEITPTTCEIDVSFNNKYTSFDLINARIETEEGEIYKNYGWMIDSKLNKFIYKFESPYFTKSNTLKFKFDGIYFKPNKDEYIVLDLNKNKILDTSGYGIDLKEIKYGNTLADDKEKYDLDIHFNITDEEIIRNMKKYNLSGGINLGEAYDQDGRVYDSGDFLLGFYELNGQYIQKVVIKKLSPETKILRFKVNSVLKGIDKPMEFEIK